MEKEIKKESEFPFSKYFRDLMYNATQNITSFNNAPEKDIVMRDITYHDGDRELFIEIVEDGETILKHRRRRL